MKSAIEKTTRVGRARVFVVGLATALSALLLALTGVSDTAQAKKKKDRKGEKIVFASDRTSGQGMNNSEGDFEIFVMNPDGKKREQLTENAVDDFQPTLSPDGQKVAFVSQNVQPSNPEGDSEVYLMNALDGSDQQNLTNTAIGISDFDAALSPDGQKIAFVSVGIQSSNREGDDEIYLMNANGSKQRNITDNGSDIQDSTPDFGEVKKE